MAIDKKLIGQLLTNYRKPCLLQAALRVQHEVDVMRGCIRAIPDEAERMLAVGGATAVTQSGRPHSA